MSTIKCKFFTLDIVLCLNENVSQFVVSSRCHFFCGLKEFSLDTKTSKMQCDLLWEGGGGGWKMMLHGIALTVPLGELCSHLTQVVVTRLQLVEWQSGLPV